MQFLLFGIGKEYFAIDAMKVQKIADPLPVTRLPYVASYIDGLVNQGGEVIAQLNLPQLFSIDIQSNGKIMVIDTNNYDMAILVETIYEKVEIDATEINYFSHATSSVEDTKEKTVLSSHISNSYVEGEFQYNEALYMVLAVDKLASLVKPAHVGEGSMSFLSKNRQKENIVREELISCLTFRICGENFAVPLLQVKELVEIDTIAKIPGTPPHVKGVASLRGQPILVLSMSSLFDYQASQESADIYNIIIVSYRDGVIGLLIDNIQGIQNFTQSQLKKEDTDNSLIAAYIIDEKQKMIMLVNMDILFEGDVFDEIDRFRPRVTVKETAQKNETLKLLKIVLANELCAIPVKHVIRLSEYQNSTIIENEQKGIVGTTEVEGEIIPLLNINKHLNIRNDDAFAKLAVIEHDSKRWALCINDAQGIIDVEIDSIDDSSQRAAVKGMANYQGELISILDFNWLVAKA